MLTEDDLRAHLRFAAPPGPVPDLLGPLRARRARQRHRYRAGAAGACAALVVVGAVAAMRGPVPAADVVQVASPPAQPGYRVAPGQLAPSSSIVELAPLRWRGQDGHVVAHLQSYPKLPAGDNSYCEGWADATGVIRSVSSCIGPAHVQGGRDSIFPAAGVFVSNSSASAPGTRPPTPSCAHGPSGNTLATTTSLRVASVTVGLSDGSTLPFSVVPGSEDWPVRLWRGTIPDRTFVVDEVLRDSAGTVLDRLGPYDVPTCDEFDSWRPDGS